MDYTRLRPGSGHPQAACVQTGGGHQSVVSGKLMRTIMAGLAEF